MTQLQGLTRALPRRIHLLGVAGAGLSGAARILHARGHRVTGHDRSSSGILELLAELELQITLGESQAEHLPADAELVVRSAAVPELDPQVVAARERGLDVLKYADLLAHFCAERQTMAVAGTHGKTTTAWMLWHALEGLSAHLGQAVPGALIGGVDRRIRSSALAANPGGAFAVEACEYDRTFLRIEPFAAAITNVEGDHLDYYGTLDAVEEAFARFADRVHADGLLVLGRDVPERVELSARAQVWRLGREFDVDLLGEREGHFRMRLRGPGWATPELALAVPGSIQVENAALALALAIGAQQHAPGGCKADPAEMAAAAAEGLARFAGVERRFEPWGEVPGVAVVHDYAHHPTELRVTLEAARRAYPGRRIHVLFQPHQHSRTARFLTEFADSLRAADCVVVADVYGARLHSDGERFAGAPELVAQLRAARVDARPGGPLRTAVRCSLDALAEEDSTPACLLVVGAGDIEDVRDELLDDLAVRCPAAPTARA